MGRYLIPLGIFIALVALLAVGLGLDPREVPSPLIDKPAPAFTLPTLYEPDRTFSDTDLLGQVTLVNVWASWCVACRQEHPLLVELAGSSDTVPVIGLNYKDTEQEAKRWLSRYGDPYTVSIVDADGRVGIDWGVYGVPETFVVDRQGLIRYKQIGPIDEQVLEETIMPLVKRLRGEAG